MEHRNIGYWLLAFLFLSLSILSIFFRVSDRNSGETPSSSAEETISSPESHSSADPSGPSEGEKPEEGTVPEESRARETDEPTSSEEPDSSSEPPEGEDGEEGTEEEGKMDEGSSGKEEKEGGSEREGKTKEEFAPIASVIPYDPGDGEPVGETEEDEEEEEEEGEEELGEEQREIRDFALAILESGDTLSSLAELLGVSESDILDAVEEMAREGITWEDVEGAGENEELIEQIAKILS